jgi:hypothetical protein
MGVEGRLELAMLARQLELALLAGQLLSQPHFWKNVRMTLTLSKWGLGSPPQLPKLQSWIAGVKTPRIGVFFISLKSYESVDVENELALAI